MPLQLGDGEIYDVGDDGLIIETDDENGQCYGECRKQHAEWGFLDPGSVSEFV